MKSMPESDETQKDIKKMKWHLENIDNKVDTLIRGNPQALEDIAGVFRGNPMMAKVYLAVDGKRKQVDIAEKLDTSQATVSRRISELDRYGLIQKKEYDNGMIYVKDELHDILRLDERVDPKAGWDDN